MPDLNSLLKKLEPKVEEALNYLKEELNGLSTGKASTTLLEDIKVAYYGTQMPLKQLANISVVDASNLAVQPFDKSSLGEIEKAIKEAELSLSVTNDGQNVRVSLPPLSDERRQELTKVVKDKAEEVRVSVRNAREEIWDQIQDLEKKGRLTEDDKYKGQSELNKKIEEVNKKIDELAKGKEKELLRV